jgi:hypothetical protein
MRCHMNGDTAGRAFLGYFRTRYARTRTGQEILDVASNGTNEARASIAVARHCRAGSSMAGCHHDAGIRSRNLPNAPAIARGSFLWAGSRMLSFIRFSTSASRTSSGTVRRPSLRRARVRRMRSAAALRCLSFVGSVILRWAPLRWSIDSLANVTGNVRLARSVLAPLFQVCISCG